MRLIRRLLQIVFGFGVLSVLFSMAKDPAANVVAYMVLVGFLVSIILVLGPWWPSAERTENHFQFRRFLQIVVGCFVFLILGVMATSPRPVLFGHLAILGLLVFAILLLGPWWPSSNINRPWKLNLPTDDPVVAAPFAAAAFGLFSFYRAWSLHTEPNQKFERFERLLGALSGADGVAVMWLAIGLVCFVGALQAWGRLQARSKKVP